LFIRWGMTIGSTVPGSTGMRFELSRVRGHEHVHAARANSGVGAVKHEQTEFRPKKPSRRRGDVERVDFICNIITFSRPRRFVNEPPSVSLSVPLTLVSFRLLHTNGGFRRTGCRTYDALWTKFAMGPVTMYGNGSANTLYEHVTGTAVLVPVIITTIIILMCYGLLLVRSQMSRLQTNDYRTIRRSMPAVTLSLTDLHVPSRI
jgi:hypothetical protein